MEVYEGKVVSNGIALFILPHLFTDHAVPNNAANDYGLVGDFDEFEGTLLSCGHVASMAQVGLLLSYLEIEFRGNWSDDEKQNGAHSIECAPIWLC